MQYNKKNSNILCAIIDLSKAFDERNHNNDKLLKSSLLKIIVYKYWIHVEKYIC